MTGTRHLYGGTILTTLAGRFEDVSAFRQVPDHQEVFADGKTDESVIIELLDREDKADQEATRYFFDDLAEANSATNVHIIESGPIPVSDIPGLQSVPGASASYIVGEQEVRKYNETAANSITIFLVVVRLPSVGTDLLLTLNRPTSISPYSSSWGVEQPPESPMTIMEGLVKNLVIKDWSLFG